MGQNHSYRICCKSEITTANNHFYRLGHFSLPFPLKYLRRLVYKAWLCFPNFGSLSHPPWSDHHCCHHLNPLWNIIDDHDRKLMSHFCDLIWKFSHRTQQAFSETVVTQQRFSCWISKWVNRAQPFWNVWHCLLPSCSIFLLWLWAHGSCLVFLHSVWLSFLSLLHDLLLFLQLLNESVPELYSSFQVALCSFLR